MELRDACINVLSMHPREAQTTGDVHGTGTKTKDLLPTLELLA